MGGKNAFEHGGNIYKAIRMNKTNYNQILDFSANINPLGLPNSIKRTLQEKIETVIHYPDAEAKALKEAISQHYGVLEEYITAGNGAVEILYILCHMLKPKRVLIPAPSFSEYERSAKASGADIQFYYLSAKDNFCLDINQLIAQLSSVDMIFLGNPNNPTGNLLSQEKIEYLLKAASKNQTLVVIDESFLDFLPDDCQFTCRHLINRYANLIVIHSLTKFYAIPGLRLGFALANKKLTQLLHNGKDPWNVNLLAQSAGVAALHDEKFQTDSRMYMEKAKNQFYSQLLSLPNIIPYPPTVNFILVNIYKTGISSEQLCKNLAKYNILVRDCSNYPGLSPDYIRLAVKQTNQNEILLQALKKIIEGGIHD